MMWHTHEQRVLMPEESPSLEEAQAFLDAHPEIVLYHGQDESSAEPRLPCADTPQLDSEVSACDEEAPRADSSVLEPCLTRITVKISYGDEELVLTTNPLCLALLR